MRKSLVLLLAAVLTCGVFGGAGRALALDSPAGQLVRQNAVAGTPHVLDGRVLAIAQVGDTMLLGGTFTLARNDGSTTELTRSRLLAFNATTGQISTAFLPEPDGTVRAILPSGDGTSVYVGGNFTTIGGVARSRLARIRVSDGAVLSTFNAGSITGEVRDLGLRNGRLWVSGAFTHVGGRAQRALTTVNPTTGAPSTFMALPIAGVHNGGVTAVIKFDITPDGSRLVAIGNFDTLSGVQNHQLFMLDLTGSFAQPSTFHTNFFTSACSSSFDTYMRDVDFSPDGSYFVTGTTGAYGGNTSACDQVSRFETAGSGEVAPSWVDYTGGDTTWSVEATDAVIYVGGHQRWWNNPFASDRAGQGAVSREGIAALDPINGLPLTWNPGRERGVGVFDFLYTDQGLWVGSDTDRINDQLKSRIARMARTGVTFPAVSTPRVPNDVYSGGSVSGSPTGPAKRYLTDSSTGASQAVPTGGIDWNGVRGAFMLNGWLYLAHSDGNFTKRTFDGSTYGASQPVNGADQIVVLSDWRNDLRTATGMFYDSGRIYFTLPNQSQLYYRYFTAQSDMVGAKRFVASGNVTGIDFRNVRGMFGTGSRLYWASSDGNLRRMDWQQGPQAGAPVPGTAVVASGPAVGGVTWGSRAIFLYQDANGNGIGQPPTASFTQSCTGLSCDFDASGSSAPGGTITSYAWQFGDGGTGNGVSPSHSYPSSGNYSVTLTVTTAAGLTGSTTRQINVQRVNQPPTASFTASCLGLVCSFNGTGSDDPDGNVASWAWNFGDGTTGTGSTASRTYTSAGPRTVTLQVTDNEGATGSTTRQVNPSAVAVNFVAAANANANASSHRVVVPATVQAGDTLVLHMSVNTATVTLGDPAGWTVLDSLTAGGVQGRSWTRTATAADAGSTVTITTSGLAKGDLSLGAYRASGGGSTAVVAHAGSVDQVTGTNHTSPTVNVATPGAWVLTYWAAKASVDIAWDIPASSVLRTSAPGAGGGRLASVGVDSGQAVPTGSAGGLVATTTPAVTRTVMFTTVVGLQ
ncbi:MAG TPA: PKD domain-containing protein [Nocardioides sp.]|nr:PKD domain-containing protein [Nocardioides sp.]